jgi:hypothetical protein
MNTRTKYLGIVLAGFLIMASAPGAWSATRQPNEEITQLVKEIHWLASAFRTNGRAEPRFDDQDGRSMEPVAMTTSGAADDRVQKRLADHDALVAMMDGEFRSWSRRREGGLPVFHIDGIWLVKNSPGASDDDHPWSRDFLPEYDRDMPSKLFDDLTSRYDRFWW